MGDWDFLNGDHPMLAEIKRLEMTKEEILAIDDKILPLAEKFDIFEQLYGKSSALEESGSTKEEFLGVDERDFSIKQKTEFFRKLYSAKPGNPVIDFRLGLNYFRWSSYSSSMLFDRSITESQHKQLMRIARITGSQITNAAVSDFTDWVYRLYVPETKDPLRLEEGARAEWGILRLKVAKPSNKNWELVYSGMADSDSKALPITELSIDGIPRFGKPDLVFREKKTGRILIIEIKTSEADIPAYGWPNLRAQLWAYSKMDEWKDASDIILVGEIWGYKNDLRIRKILRWDKGDPDFEKENAELFECYKSNNGKNMEELIKNFSY